VWNGRVKFIIRKTIAKGSKQKYNKIRWDKMRAENHTVGRRFWGKEWIERVSVWQRERERNGRWREREIKEGREVHW
jgi:hypothetical protein